MTNQKNKTYQLTCLFHPSLNIEKINETIEKIKQAVISNEEVSSEKKDYYSSEPVKKSLAYLIKKQKEAFYWNFNFLFPPKEIDKIRQKLSQEKNILRCSIISRKKTKSKPIKESIDLKIIDKIEPLSDKESPVFKDIRKKSLKEKIKIEDLDKKLEEILNQ